MSVSKADIQQIRRYLNGELDARAMYELELRAQNNADLMDVMLGMEAAQTNHQPQIDELNELIAHRAAKDKRRVVPMYRTWAAAASVLLLLGIGGWWLSRETPKTQLADNITLTAPVDVTKTDTAPTIAKIPKPVDDRPQLRAAESAPATPSEVKIDPPSPADIKPDASAKASRALPADLIESIKIDSNAGALAKNSISDKEKALAYNYSSAVQQKAAHSVFGARTNQTVNTKDTGDHRVANVEQMLQGKLAGIAVQPDGAIIARAPVKIRGLSNVKDSAAYKTLTGTIIDAKTGDPLIGASVVSASGNGTQADINGKFTLTVPKADNDLTAMCIGYSTQKIALNNRTDIKFALDGNNASLSEVVVVGYGSRKKNRTSAAAAATIGCQENAKFKTRFFDYIALVEKYTTEQTSGAKRTVTDKQVSKALKFIAQHIAVAVDTNIKNGTAYADFEAFKNDKAEWLKWYEANKCKNLN